LLVRSPTCPPFVGRSECEGVVRGEGESSPPSLAHPPGGREWMFSPKPLPMAADAMGAPRPRLRVSLVPFLYGLRGIQTFLKTYSFLYFFMHICQRPRKGGIVRGLLTGL